MSHLTDAKNRSRFAGHAQRGATRLLRVGCTKRYRRGMSVEWPDQRGDVVNGLDIMAAEPVLDVEDEDRRCP